MKKLARKLVVGVVVLVMGHYFLSAAQTEKQVRSTIGESRVHVLPPTSPLTAGEPNELTLSFAGYKVRAVHEFFGCRGHSGFVSGSTEVEPVIRYRSDGTTFIDVTPLRAEKLDMNIVVEFTDGQVDKAALDVECVLPPGPPTTVTLDSGRKSEFNGTIYLDSSKEEGFARLLPSAIYGAHGSAISLRPKGVQFRIISDHHGDSPITLDEDRGVITAHHGGHAFVLATVDGVSGGVCVDVMSSLEYAKEDVTCSELIPKGMSLPPLPKVDLGSAPKVIPRKEPR